MFRVLKYAIFITFTFVVFFWIIKSPGVAVFEWLGFRVETNIIFCVLLVTIISILVKMLFNISVVKIFQKYNIYQYVFVEGKKLQVSDSEITEMLAVLERGKNSHKHIRNIFIAKKLAVKNKVQEALKIIQKMEKVSYLSPLYKLNSAFFNTEAHNVSIVHFSKALKENKDFIDNAQKIFDLIIKEQIVEEYAHCIKILENQKNLSLENQKILYTLNVLKIQHLIERNEDLETTKKLTFELVKSYPQFFEGYTIIRSYFDDSSFINAQMLNAISEYNNPETAAIVNDFVKHNNNYIDTKDLLDKREPKNNKNMLSFTKAKLAIKNQKYDEAKEELKNIENLYYKKLILAEIEAHQGLITEAFETIVN